MTAKEVGPVMKVLQDNGVHAVALHSHALDDVPRLFYMHFWANDDAVKLAKILRGAVDATNSAKWIRHKPGTPVFVTTRQDRSQAVTRIDKEEYPCGVWPCPP